MTQKLLALYDNRPFFERALQYGVKSWVIDSKKLDEILQDGPKWVVQIARVFGSEYIRPDLENAKNRIVNLVSLYLEDVTGWNIDQAAKLLAEQPLLSLSKRWSDMIKRIHTLPEYPLFGKDIITSVLEETYDSYAPGTETYSWLITNYKKNRNLRLKNDNIIRASEWLVSQFPKIPIEDLSGYSAEWIINTLTLFSLEGYDLKSLPNKSQILMLLSKYQLSKPVWDALIRKSPVVYIPTIKNSITYIEQILKKIDLCEEDIDIFESGDFDISDIDEYESWIHKDLEEKKQRKSKKKVTKTTK